MLIIMAWLIMGLIMVAGVFLVMFWRQWDSLKVFIKTYYRHWRSWSDTIISIILWPMLLFALLNYVFNECEELGEDLA